MKMRLGFLLLALSLFLCLLQSPAYAKTLPSGRVNADSSIERRTIVPEGVTEIDLRTVLGDDALDVNEVWMLNADVCIILRELPEYWGHELILLDMRDCSVLSRTPVPLTWSPLKQFWDGDTLCLLFNAKSLDWYRIKEACIKVTIAADGTVNVGVSEQHNITIMPSDDDTAIREASDGSLYVTDLYTGEEELLIQGVAGPNGGMSYEDFLAYVPCWDELGYNGESSWGSDHPVAFPLNEKELERGYMEFFRSFRVYRPLDEYRFIYAVDGWEIGAGYGIYDLETRTDHRITGRGYFMGMGGNTLYGSYLMADVNTYESSPVPETVREQFEEASEWKTNYLVGHDISPDGKLLALTGMIPRSISEKRWWDTYDTEPKFDYAHTVTVTDIRTGDIIKTYDIDNPFATEHTVTFIDDTRLMLLCLPKDGGSAYIYLFNIED